MFTGIVRSIGVIDDRIERDGGLSLSISDPAVATSSADGDSIAVSGVCLTVTGRDGNRFRVDAVRATLERTTLGSLAVGDRVNLEPALRAGEPLGGHLLQGHIDAVGDVVGVEREGEGAVIEVRLPDAVAAVTVSQGSLAIDGVSLTVNRLDGAVARFAIIPYTWTHTTLHRLETSARVNVEADMIGKYVDRMVRPFTEGPRT
ncbi:MAG: riboflavin synthase [Gemmatimonadetes bacterium]|nr:riboflavin synthase [Gemmatimonadota bacterium]